MRIAGIRRTEDLTLFFETDFELTDSGPGTPKGWDKVGTELVGVEIFGIPVDWKGFPEALIREFYEHEREIDYDFTEQLFDEA